MKRFAPLLIVVLALAAVPAVALAEDSPPAQPASAAQPAHRGAPVQLQILRLQLRLVQLRHRVACRDEASDRCAEFKDKAVARLTKLEGNVQSKLAELQKCTAESTDKLCKNADRKIDALTKLDDRLNELLDELSA